MEENSKSALTASLEVLEKTKNYNRWIYDNVKEFAGKNILEIGCGTGNNTDMLISPGRKITGIEIDRTYAACAEKKYAGSSSVKILHGDFLKSTRLKKASFDTAIMLNVLEHIKDDAAAVKKIHLLLKKNGVFINLVPAMRFAYGTLDKNLGHYKRYEKKDMRMLLENSGFKTEKLFYMNAIGALAWCLNRNRAGFPAKSPVIFDKFFVPVLKPLENVFRPLIFAGQSLISISRKI